MGSYIINSLRTPIGSYNGQLASFSAPQLGSKVISALISRINVNVKNYDQVIMGNVLAAGLGQAPARQAALSAGMGISTECLTINKMCGSGLKAIMIADNEIKLGGADLVIAGGMESMSNAPLLLNKNLGKIGHQKMIDSMIHDGLWDVYDNMHMGSCAELLVSKKKYSKKDQDDYAIKSYKKAQNAIFKGFFANEVVGILHNDKLITDDEEPGRAKFEKIPLVKPAFEKNGTITAANASKLNDGAAAAVLASEKKISQYSLDPDAKIIAHCSFAHNPKWFTTAPTKAIKKVLDLSGMSKDDIDLWEINEAFSAVTMAAIEDLRLDEAKVNIFGGAVALGHPIGASGARILTTLLNALKISDKKFGLACLCIGGGEASAMIVEKL